MTLRYIGFEGVFYEEDQNLKLATLAYSEDHTVQEIPDDNIGIVHLTSVQVESSYDHQYVTNFFIFSAGCLCIVYLFFICTRFKHRTVDPVFV